VARHCDNTVAVDKKRVSFCALKHLFSLEGDPMISNQKYRQNLTEMHSPMRYQCHDFKFSRLMLPKYKTALPPSRDFLQLRVVQFL